MIAFLYFVLCLLIAIYVFRKTWPVRFIAFPFRYAKEILVLLIALPFIKKGLKAKRP